MFPVLLKTPWFTIYSYGVFLAAAYLSAIELAFRKGEAEEYDPAFFSNLILVAVLSAFAGSRLFFVWIEWPSFRAEPWRAFFLWEGGFVFYGGLLASVGLSMGYVLWKRQSVLKLLDLCVPSIAFGHAVGRIGCLGVGCCYGAPTDLPWGIVLPNVTNVPPGTMLHPVQAYASISLFALWATLEHQWRRTKDRHPGWVFVVYCYWESVARYLMEVFRIDPRGGTFHLGMSVSQEIAVGLGLVGFVTHVWLRTRYWPSLAAAGEGGHPPPGTGSEGA